MTAALFSTLLFSGSFATSAADKNQKPTKTAAWGDLRAQYFVNALDVKNQMLSDYRKLLEVYYDYKTKSPNPTVFPNASFDPKFAEELKDRLSPAMLKTFSEPKAQSFDEFSSRLYDEFATELDADPRLKGNSYRQFMRSYGGSGRDNDVLQRLYMQFDKNFTNVDQDSLAFLHEEIKIPMTGLGMSESKKILSEVSIAAGYPANRQSGFELDLAKFENEVKIALSTNRRSLKKIRSIQKLTAAIFTTSDTCIGKFEAISGAKPLSTR